MLGLESWLARVQVDKHDLPPLLNPYLVWGQRYTDKFGDYTGGKIMMNCWPCKYCKVIECKANRNWPIEVGSLTKTRGLEVSAFGKQYKAQVDEFIQRTAEGLIYDDELPPLDG